MKINQIIEALNEAFGRKCVSVVFGYSKKYGIQNGQGVVDSTFTARELRAYAKSICVI